MSDHAADAPSQALRAGQAARRGRVTSWGLCLLTLLLTIAVLRAIKASTGLELFSVTVKAFVPAGAIGAAVAALSGFWIGAGRTRLAPDRWDLLFLMAVCLMLQFLPVSLDYLALLQAHPELSGHVGFARYFSDSLTMATYMVGTTSQGYTGPQPMGDSGLAMLLPRIGCLLAMAKVIHSNSGHSKDFATVW